MERKTNRFKPRSGAAVMGGLPWLPRMSDKARAKLDGNLGDYIFPCPIDRLLLLRLGISPDAFLDIVAKAECDADVVKAVRHERGK